jgi:hypothetical protein
VEVRRIHTRPQALSRSPAMVTVVEGSRLDERVATMIDALRSVADVEMLGSFSSHRLGGTDDEAPPESQSPPSSK